MIERPREVDSAYTNIYFWSLEVVVTSIATANMRGRTMSNTKATIWRTRWQTAAVATHV